MMKVSLHVIVAFVLTILLSGCSESARFKAKLERLDSALVSYPDSVYGVLNGMRKEAESQPLSVRMYYELIKADAQNKAYIDFTTDSTMLVVADYYKQRGTGNERMRAFYLLGCTYRDLRDVPMELQCFQEAVEYADTTQKDCDLYTLYAIYSQMADIYFDENLPEEELRMWDICKHIAEKDKDTLSAIKAYELRMRPFYLMNKHDSVVAISERARKLYLMCDDTLSAAQLLVPEISILLDREEYEKAGEYMDIFKNESDYFQGDTIAVPRVYLYYRSMGRYALHKKQYSVARRCFEKLIACGEKEAGCQGMLRLYQCVGTADSVVKYSGLYATANDSTHIGKNTETVAKMRAVYDYAHEKNIAEKAKDQLLLEKGRSITYLSIIFLMMVFFVAIYLINRKVRRNNIDKIKELTREIEHKSLLLNDALHHNDEDMLRSLQTSLKNAQNELTQYRKSDTLAAFFDSDIYKLFQKLGRRGDAVVVTKEWDMMDRLFCNTFCNYVDFLHSGKSMTNDQMRICMLIRMGFGETEMANIMHVDLKRITRVKAQVNQKLFGVQGAKELINNLEPYF